MKFREYDLPTDTNYMDLDEVPEDTKQILDIYDGIYGRAAVYRAERANELLDKFVDQQCFIVEEDESGEDDMDVIAVANYRQEMKRGFAWLEGLAVRDDYRRQRTVGRFVLENLVEITRESGLFEIRLKSVPTAVPFYQRNGFVVIEGNKDFVQPNMSLEIK